MLSGTRALDLTDEKGFLCGKMLADLGVDVIKVERPGGDPSRRIGPFWGDVPDPERSLNWFAYNTNKRGITLNVETADGKQILGELVKSTDFVIESFAPGYVDNCGIGYSWLSGINRAVILASISPFGQSGPYREHKAPDIVAMGMSGALYLEGDIDRRPVNVSLPQSYLLASADAAVGALIAYFHKQKTGEGQHVDASMQHSTAWYLGNAIPFWELKGEILQRSGAFRTGMSSKISWRQVWQCKDGYIFYAMLGGKGGAKTARELVKWMDGEGRATDYLKNLDWENLDMSKVTQEELDEISNPIQTFFMAHTRREILDGVVERHLSICPLSSVSDLLSDAQLEARNFWTTVEHSELGASVTYPREFVKSSENVCSTRFRAPLIGEHNEVIYGEIGLTKQELTSLKQAGVI